ncbi:Gfo/Idh/MocA family oxidoreductase [Flagellimonas sp. 389]|uniref:Gfo/Idh/MocA family protein n=1 Tax=Flagellimonas sp. 389 TaxID=2835862 RepID=UPI001BD60374|nr:Gfo/Idh/MocA family oxidoreductase [Flagellimonas sp. 389]MBS9463529.1 Gfo/Idh/MocA family oxidoreductase [Flagellimonas sp. 389]
MKRRDFIVGTGAAALTAVSYGNILGANDKIGIAVVGAGRRGRWVLGEMLKTNQIKPVIFCDVWDEQVKRTIDYLALGDIPMTYNLDEVLTNKNVDAVLLATPDHLHKNYAIQILEAGKHLLLEKPVTLHFDEGTELKEAVVGSNVICQTGTQQRSAQMYQRVKEEFFGGSKKLGDIVFVRAVWSNFGWQRRQLEQRPKPENFKWDMFLGPAPKTEYYWPRYDGWRHYKEYGTGILSDLLTHWGDVAQWMMDDTNPLNAVTTGGIYHMKDDRTNPDTVNTIVQYKGGWNFTFECSILPIKNQHDSVLFHGTEGKLELFRSGYRYTPHKGKPMAFQNAENLTYAHAKNFLDAIKGKTRLSAPIEVGLNAVKPSHLAAASYWSGQRMQFNADQTKIIAS